MRSNSFDRAEREYERRRRMSPEDEEDEIRQRQRLDERDMDRADHLRDEAKDRKYLEVTEGSVSNEDE